MKKLITIILPVIFILLTSSVFIVYYLFDTDRLIATKTDKRELDRLFDDLGVLKLPERTDTIEIILKDLYGNHISLSDFKGKIVFLNFWTTWCPTCRVEMASMQKLHQKLKNKDFVMVSINIQESEDQVKNFFKEFKLTFTVLMDTIGEVAAGFNISAIPTTFILDRHGRIIGSLIGPREWDSRESVALFEYLIDKYASTTTLTSAD